MGLEERERLLADLKIVRREAQLLVTTLATKAEIQLNIFKKERFKK